MIKKCEKKITSLILLAALITTIFPGLTIHSQEFEVKDYSLLLNRLGISTASDKDAFITRGDFTVMALQAAREDFRYPDTSRFSDVSGEQGEYINTAAELGYVNGNDDGLFHPDRIITVDEALQICSRVLGFDKCDSGFFSVKSKLLKNVLSKDKLSGFDAQVIIFNMLNSKYVLVDSYSETMNTSYTLSDDTHLSKTFSVYEITGVVSAISGISQNGVSSIDEAYIKIGNNTYLNNYYDDYLLLGKEVDCYCVNEEVIYLTSKEDDTKVINTRDISRVSGFGISDDSNSKAHPYLIYEDNSTKEKTLKIDKNLTVILNGEKKMSVSNSDFINDAGTVVLNDSNSDDVYDVALIEKYVFYYVSAVDESAEKIYDMYGKETIDLSRFKEEKVSLISNDNAVECSSISPGVILRVVCSFDAYGKIDYNRTFAAEILTQSVTGKISGKTDDNEFEIGGDYYYVLPEIAAELKLGDNTTFMLGMDNLIVAYLDFNQTDALEYGYLVDKGKKSGISKDYLFKIYTASNKMIVVPWAEDFKFTGMYDGNYVNKRTLKSEKVDETIQSGQLIKYTLNEKGEISLIELAYDTTTDEEYDGFDNNRFTLEYKSNRESVSGSNFSENYYCSGNTLCFFVTEDATDEGDFYVGKYYAMGRSLSDVGIKLYDSDNMMNLSVAVIENCDLEWTRIDSQLYEDEYAALIYDKKYVLDDDGNYVVQYNVYQKSTRILLQAESEELPPINNCGNTDLEYPFKSTRNEFGDLECGDVILFEKNFQGKVDKYLVIHEYDSTHEKKLHAFIDGRSTIPSQSYGEVIVGNIKKFVPNSNFMMKNTGLETRKLNFSSSTVFYYVYHVDSGEVEFTTTIPYLDFDDYVFVNLRRGRIRTAILYVNN